MAYIKKNRWIIILISFIVINVGWMAYSRGMNKDIIQLGEKGIALEQKEYEENKEVQEESEDKRANTEGKEAASSLEVPDPNDTMSAEETTSYSTIAEVEEVPIYICGEVKAPGVYYVPTHAIINDVIEKGGGFTDEANQMAINLASQIVPNEKIIVPKVGEEIDKLMDSYDNRERIESNSVSSQAIISQNTLINLNTATKQQLMTLNGIGEVKAMAIIAYRQEKGIFSSVDEIKNISGIGGKTFEKIKQFITT